MAYLGDEGFVELGGEDEREGVVSQGRVAGRVLRLDENVVGVVLLCGGQVAALVHHVRGVLAHALRAVHISVLRIADASASLRLVPVVVAEGGWVDGVLLAQIREVFISHCSVVHVFDVRASAVTTAIIGALRSRKYLLKIDHNYFRLTFIVSS